MKKRPREKFTFFTPFRFYKPPFEIKTAPDTKATFFTLGKKKQQKTTAVVQNKPVAVIKATGEREKALLKKINSQIN